MSIPRLSPAAMGIIDWLTELGPRWGLPGNACRVHALLYLVSQPVPASGVAATLAMNKCDVDGALTWLVKERLVSKAPDGWTTGADPWAVMIQAMEARRTRELATARKVLRAWRRGAKDEDPLVARQASRLYELLENLAAIDAGTRRLSPEAIRRLVGVGGRAARLVDRAFGKREQA